MLLAVHQPNFIPWMPYFEKMALCDRFVVLAHCQFEKGGFTNRCEVWNRWWSNPVKQGSGVEVFDKRYADGQRLVTTNMHWLCAVAMTLGIDTNKLVLDEPTKTAKTARIVELCKKHRADGYLANAQALDAYLNVDELRLSGVRFIPFEAKLKRHPFEMFAEHGIERTKELFWRAVAAHKEALQPSGANQTQVSEAVTTCAAP